LTAKYILMRSTVIRVDDGNRALETGFCTNDRLLSGIAGVSVGMAKSLLRVEPSESDYRRKKQKYCSTCDRPATVDALFDVGNGVTSIEKYCDACSKKLGKES